MFKQMLRGQNKKKILKNFQYLKQFLLLLKKIYYFDFLV